MGRGYRIAAGALFFALVSAYVCVNGYRLFLGGRADDGWLSGSERGVTQIIQVDARGPAAGVLRAGDELLEVGGRGGLVSGDAVNEAMRRIPVGEPYRVVVRREGRLQELSLATRPRPLASMLGGYALKVLTPLSFLLAGLTVFLLKPADKEALLLALMLGMFTTLGSAYFAGYAGLPAWLGWALWAARVVSFAGFSVVFLHFFLLFPESKGFASPILRRAPRAERGIYSALVVLLPFGVFIVTAQSGGLDGAGAGLLRAAELVFAAGMLFVSAFIGAGLVSLVLNYRLAGVNARRKMRVVVGASLLAFVPLFFLLIIEAAGLIPAVRPVNRWIAAALDFVLPLVPLSFAYAIARHKVIPVSLIIRRGVRYLLVARGSVVLEMATVGLVMFFLMDALFARTTATGRTVGVVSGVVAILVWVSARALHRRVVAPAIDRRFFRRSYNAQQILAELGQTLRTLPRVEETCALVSARVQEALQTENVTVFLREGETGDFVAECSARFDAAERRAVVGHQELRLARDSAVVARLSESAQPVEIDFADPQGWARSLLPAGDGAESRRLDAETLRAARSALLLPVATREQLAGVISLGPRLGDLPFSGEDTQMLSTVAVQVAFALENARLLERRAEEERLRRELEMATEVQQRIFPERPPETDALELAGSCLPARGVGGDYYDFLLLDGDGGGRVGLAVADVAGKGMSAALLMSIVQASLRSQAGSAGGDLSGLVASMNRLLHRSSGTSSYATFFYAQFEPETRRLTYVNAGHNPPLLVRADPAAATTAASTAAQASEALTGVTKAATTEALTDVAMAATTNATTATTGAMTATTAEASAGATTVGAAAGGGGARVETLRTGGPVIGLFEHFTFDQETVQLARGDVLVAFTDGVSEALNPEGEEFGEPRLFALAAAHAALTAAEIHARVSAEVRAFCRDAPQHDDLTLVVAKVR